MRLIYLQECITRLVWSRLHLLRAHEPSLHALGESLVIPHFETTQQLVYVFKVVQQYLKVGIRVEHLEALVQSVEF